MSLELTNGAVLRLFPADDEDDVPRYSVQRPNVPGGERFISMIPEDKLTFEEEDGVTVVKIAGKSIGVLSSENLDTDGAKLNEPMNESTPAKKGKKAKKRKAPEGHVKPETKDDAKDEFVKQWEQSLEFVSTRDTGSVARDTSNMTSSLRKHLHEQESNYLEDGKLSFRFLTWNLRGDPIYTTPEDISDLFTTSKGDKLDLYFVAFQEIVPLNAKNFRSSHVPVENWITRIIDILGEEYTILQTNKLLGLASILICRTSLVINFNDLNISSIGTGILNIYGNKGAIATSFKIYDYNFTLLDCHFAAGESEHFVLKRRKELQGIKNYIKLPRANGSLMNEDKSILFDVDEMEGALKALEVESDEELDEDDVLGDFTISDTRDEEMMMKETRPTSVDGESSNDREKNIIFIGGDMNYRIKASRELIDQLIQAKDYQALLDYDALSIEKDQGRIFQDYKEGKIEFPPTYKIDVLKKGYEADRRPSYTDRILHSSSKHVTIDTYSSPDIFLSDHRPVYTDYTLQVPLINNEKRQAIVTSFLKHIDDQENNAKRTTLEINPVDPHVTTSILSPTKIEIKMINTGNCKTYWEVLDTVDTIDSRFPIAQIPSRIEPKKGVLPKTATQTLTITSTLPIGCRKLTSTIILRSYNSHDHFITATFEAKDSYFGATVDELHHGHSSGIPKPIYTLINYLTQNIKRDMFNEEKLNFTHDLEKKIVQWLDDDKELDTKELTTADEILDGSSSTAVARVLLLLLRNLDGGIVSEDLATFLLTNFKGDDEILEKILENLPPLRANLLIYLASFLRLCVDFGIPKDEIFKKFENLLIDVPQRRKRDMVLGRTNYEKLRREFMEKLVG
ncbi:Type I inositol polyphosphate 5-phosphatase 8 [Cyberlindnera fabianii]|uniref:Type I inositol polyphosphate 5-phosphatase 8 n=1 Tax=Cyberlindnera fabianii TaxID=36022 RepID=A0A1V2LFN0_CYBFA|nr:Type I inositol polyphosphate 5-phosphatase 8 [Cyberlindnera fabianii]